jgi:hypothetical protein
MMNLNRASTLTREQKDQLLRQKLKAQSQEFEGGGLDQNALDKLNADFDKNNKLVRQKTRTSDETRIEGLDQFQEHADLFQDLTKRRFIDTKVDVVNGIITYDSKNCVVICSKDDENMELQSYSLTPPYA